MTHTYLLVWNRPHRVLRHTGEREYRSVGLFIDGRLFENFCEDTEPVRWARGPAFDQHVKDRVEWLREFFPGPAINVRMKEKPV